MVDGSVVGDAAVRRRGVGVNDVAASAQELDERARVSAWARSRKSETRVFFTCVMFLTRVPCPGWCDHHPGYLQLALAWFPIVGAVIGFWAGAVFDAARILLPSATLCSAASLASSLWLCMCFHDDGLADSFDALAGGWSRAEVLAIMKDSRLGTFGTAALSMFLAVKLAVVAELGAAPTCWRLFGSTGAAPSLLVAHSVARATSAPLIYSCIYVVDEEDAKGDFYSWFARSRDLLSPSRVAFSTCSAIFIATVVLGIHAAAVALCVLIFCCALSKAYAKRVLGGVQGDYLGCTICLTELCLYVAFDSCVSRLPPGEPIRFVLPDALIQAESGADLLLALAPVLHLAGTAVCLFGLARCLK